LHRDHLGRVLAGLVLQHRLEDLRLHVPGEEPVKHRFWVGLVDVVGLGSFALGLALGDLGGDQHPDRRFLLERRDPFRVAQEHRVGVALRVLLQRDGDRRQHLRLARAVGQVADLGDHVAPVPEQEVATFPAQRDVAWLIGVVLLHIARRGADVVDVDCARQSLVGRDQDHHRALALAADQERVLVFRRALADRLQHLEHLVGVGSRRLHSGLRPPEARRGHDLHRLRDLLSVLDRVDAADDVPVRRHVSRRLS